LPDPSGLSSLERVELLSELEARHGVSIDEEAFSKATSANELQELLKETAPSTHRADPTTSLWPIWAPFRLLRTTFQNLGAVPLFRNRLPLTVVGLENVATLEPPVLFAANHTSDLDTPAIFTALPSKWR